MANESSFAAICGKLLVSLAFLAVSAGCQHEVAAPPPKKAPEVFVAHPVEEVVTDFEEYTGRMAPVRMVEIRSRVSGYLDEVQFTDGMDLNTDTPLFKIDQRPYAATLNAAEAHVIEAEARLERLRRREARLATLVKQQVTAEEELEQSQYERMEADGALKAAQATLTTARLDMEFTEIKAPFSGRISHRLVDPGNLVRADDTILATIVTLDPIYAYFDVDERTVLKVRRMIGEGRVTSARDKAIEVDVGLADETEYTLKGRVNFVDNQISATSGTLRLRAEIENPRKLLAPGMFVRVKVPIGIAHSAVLVQEESLGSDQGQRYVYVLNDKDEVEYRRVDVGRTNRGLRIVDNGLKPSDRVIVSGLQRVRPGVKVQPKLKPITQPEVQQAEEPAPVPVLVGPEVSPPPTPTPVPATVGQTVPTVPAH